MGIIFRRNEYSFESAINKYQKKLLSRIENDIKEIIEKIDKTEPYFIAVLTKQFS